MIVKRSLPTLTRRQAFLKPKKRFIIFLEGKNTEAAYFEMIRRSHAHALLKIEVSPGVGSPITIAQTARAAIKTRRSKKESFEELDEVWAVFDRDEHERWNEAIQMCKDAGVLIGYSNPCFELWLILHYIEHDSPDTHHEMQKLATEVVDGYDLHGRKIPNCDKLVNLVNHAETRAERQLKRRTDEGNPQYGRPSTTVGVLTRSIRTWNPNILSEE